MIKITMIADVPIETVSAARLEDLMNVLDMRVKRTSIKRLTAKQYDKALAR